MNLEKRISAFAKLGDYLHEFLQFDESRSSSLQFDKNSFQEFEAILAKAKSHNAWFTRKNLELALASWATSLSRENLEKWLKPYSIAEESHKTVAIIMAGNLPLVGFHDFLAVLLSGKKVLAKLSSDDKFILPFLSKVLTSIAPGFSGRIHFAEAKLEGFDAVIATGSSNTSRYFEYYFKKKPHIIRKNRNGAAVLTGRETSKQLEALGQDIFRFFGMGCRSVSQLFVPRDYDFKAFFEAMVKQAEVINHHKYANNYDYNKAVYMMSLYPILDNNFMILKQDEGFSSPIAVVFYAYYDTQEALREYLVAQGEKIQCVVSSGFIAGEVPFGEAQEPKLWDYADGVDSIEFLSKIG
ncbi:MAG: acyl-CoA reductase [Cytophagaceae bacterium]|nr:acyl-CoA reductase [Cytophagaceae bacterium]